MAKWMYHTLCYVFETLQSIFQQVFSFLHVCSNFIDQIVQDLRQQDKGKAVEILTILIGVYQACNPDAKWPNLLAEHLKKV